MLGHKGKPQYFFRSLPLAVHLRNPDQLLLAAVQEVLLLLMQQPAKEKGTFIWNEKKFK